MLTVITSPTVEPVTVAEAKVASRVDPSAGSAEDSLIETFIAAARAYGESFTERQFAQATYDLKLDAFPSCGYIPIPRPPLASVTHVKYLDSAGVEQTLATNQYNVRIPAGETCEPGLITTAYLAVWPATYPVVDAVRVRFVAGYSTVPGGIRAALLKYVEELYNHRGDSITGTISAAVQRGIDDALWPFRVWPKVAA